MCLSCWEIKLFIIILWGSYNQKYQGIYATTGAAIGEPLRGHADYFAFPLGVRFASGSHATRSFNSQTFTAVGKPLVLSSEPEARKAPLGNRPYTGFISHKWVVHVEGGR